jgi:hypothetical protein
MRPRRAKPLQLQQARVYVTWPSPQVRRWKRHREVHPISIAAINRIRGMKFASESLNGAGTEISEKVHLGEIAVSLGRQNRGGAA